MSESPKVPVDCRGEVLVVDDDDLFLRVCSGILKKAGLRVETSNDPTRAIERLSTHRFDAIVSDVCMPNVNGLSLLKAVREVDVSVPVVLMTGAPTLETAISAIDLGVHKLMPKPFDVDAFITAVQGAVNHRRDRQGGEAAHERFEKAVAGLWLAHQPIVSLHGKYVAAYEALLRSHTPGIQGPGEMLTLAETTGRVHELGRLIRARAASDAESLPGDALLFVNLHPDDLDDAELFSPTAPLSQHAGRVVLEITERASLAEDTRLADQVGRLRKLGYRIAIDDLGAGYSGLTTLARVQPEFVKLDAALTHCIEASAVNQLVITSVLDLSNELHAQVIAEAIETEKEVATLTALGVNLMQGYFFARPAPPYVSVSEARFTHRPVAPPAWHLRPPTRRDGPDGKAVSPGAAENQATEPTLGRVRPTG